MKEKDSSLNVQEVYKDDSKEILREILVEDHDVDEEDADDFEVEVDEDNGVSTASNEVDDEEDNNEEDSDDGIIQKRKVLEFLYYLTTMTMMIMLKLSIIKY